jgi:hypothetical protein
MPFKQTFTGAIQEVYNVDGTLMLNRQSGPPDLASALIRLRAEIDALPALSPEERKKIDLSLNAALSEAKSGKPNGKALSEHLESASQTMSAISGLAESGRKMVEVLISIGKWAALCFG